MNNLVILAMSDPEMGKIIGSVILGPLIVLAYFLYQNSKEEK